jgi:hypothetical protein
MSTDNVNATVRKQVEFVKRASDALDHAEKRLNEYETLHKAAAARIPETIETLVKHQCFPDTPEHRKAAAAILTNPESTLEILMRVAQLKSPETNAAVGSGVEKTASDNDVYKPGPYVGVRTFEKTAADIEYETKLGLR